jgi:hypothetical protein
VTLILSLAALVVPAPAEPMYWERQGCSHGHKSAVAYKVVRHHLKNHNPYPNKKRVRHWIRCVGTKEKSRAVRRLVKRLWEWRKKYENKWPIKFHRLPQWAQTWAWSTGACESGNRSGTATGNGFYGAFQFLLSTWAAAGGEGLPHQHSWYYQAWIAVNLMFREGAGHWPRCG